jgi:hypothetical protein
VMYDDLNTPDDHADAGLDFRAPQPKASENGKAPEHRLPDREVPLPTSGAASVLHQWLDGDVGVAAVRATQGGSDVVDLWTKIHDEAETLRSRTTPLYVHKRIMDSLPDDTYRGHHPWYKRSIGMSPAAMIAAAAALIGIGAVVAQVVFK